jgi:hypothetical protein
MPHDPLTAVRQRLLGMLRDEGVGFGPQRRRQHPPGAVARDLGQRIVHGSGLVKRGDRGIVVHGVSLLREVLAGLITRHDTPPSQAPSLIFEHSSATCPGQRNNMFPKFRRVQDPRSRHEEHRPLDS